MDIISMILLAVVLVAQIVLFVLFFLEKRYVNYRLSTMLQYIDRKVEDADCRDEVEENYREIRSVCEKAFESQNKEIEERFKILALDYAQAQEAAGKINSFAENLASIFDYDPLVAIKKGRKKEAS